MAAQVAASVNGLQRKKGYPYTSENTQSLHITQTAQKTTTERSPTIEGHSEIQKFAVTNLGRSDVFLGHEWLSFYNPEVDWTTGLPDVPQHADTTNQNQKR